MIGVLAPNDLLKKADLLALGKINGPEEVAVDPQGRIYGGTQDGKILRPNFPRPSGPGPDPTGWCWLWMKTGR